jgi:putative SOS response-associated peptidase YedK
MCGRFNVSSDPLTILLLELVGMAHPGPDNHNAAPTENIVVLRLGEDAQPELVTMRWWLTPFWSKEVSTRYSMFNAKSETAAQSPAFREPFKKRRCVVPVSGFYEWVRENNTKLPYYITPHDAPGMLLAGLWDRWNNPESGEVLESFTILTTAAAPGMEFVHKRQPVILGMADAHRWMDPGNEEFASLISNTMPYELDAIPVSTYVNTARHKDERCLEPLAAPIHIDGSGV